MLFLNAEWGAYFPLMVYDFMLKAAQVKASKAIPVKGRGGP
jgi:hypothetical protein